MPLPSTASALRRGSRRWTVVGPAGAVDVDVLARDDEPLHAVLADVARVVGTPATSLFSGTTRLPHDLPLRDERLRHGAVLGIGRPTRDTRAQALTGALAVRVVGGADAGRSIALGNGRHLIGRSQECALRLDDPDVSRHHVALHVGGGTVEVTDLGSSNGTRLDDLDLAVTERTSWPVGTRLQVGGTRLMLAGADDVPASTGSSVDGRTVLRPPVRIPDVPAAVDVAFPQAPAAPPARRLAWVAVALPAAGGITLAVVLNAPSFLFFALLSPVVAVATWWSDRRSGRRAHRQGVADFRLRTAAAESRLAEAVRDEVAALHRRLPDLAALASAARRRTSLLWSRSTDDADLLRIRIGIGRGATGVVRREPDGLRVAASADDLPVDVDLRAGGLAVVGPRAPALGVLRSSIGQLAALHPPDTVELVLVTSASRLHDWRWMRWLPHLRSELVPVPDGPGTAGAVEEAACRSLVALVERRRAIARSAAGRAWSGPWAAVVVDGHLPSTVGAVLSGAADVGVTVLTHGPALGEVPVPVIAALLLTGELGTHAGLRMRGAPLRQGIAVDRLPLEVAADLARDLAGVAPPAGRSTLPSDVRFLDVAGPEIPVADDVGAPGRWSRERGSLDVALGVGIDGVERLDLCRHGPHALIAGTTGAGKSELLQTLIAGLALAHPPDRCSFLLVDYKGGAAFAEAAALPHTVGLLTDLDDSTTARALRSLTAELARREALLAAHAVADITDLHDDVPLARLVIVVDEFATLAEELPAFVPGLVGIAQRGRSLGIHLVLATQRPAGVVSADIRANCTLRICLRTTDEADSRDVLGGPEAAHLPLDLPGRAFVRAGNGRPRLLQVARVSQTCSADGDAPVVSPWCWPIPPARPAPSSDGGASDLGRLVRGLEARARSLALPRPHRPWRPPLPSTVSLSDAEALTGTADRRPTQLLLGVADHPDRQEQRPLVLDLSSGGGWLAVGGPRSGRTTLLRSVLRQSTAGQPADRLHVHVVDLGGGGLAAEAAGLTCVGTAIGGDDALRTVRLVHRLSEEVARRRSAGSLDQPRILLLVDGAEALCSLLDDADPARGSAELLRLVRDGAAAGVTCVLTADRAVPGGRLAGVAQQRLVLPLPDRADYAVAGVALSAVPSTRPPGRALVGNDAAECQLAVPPPLDPRARTAASGPGRHPAPLRIAELPTDPLVDGTLDRGARSSLRVVLGPGGDEGEPLTVELLRSGGLLVVGPPGSGRSSALEAVIGDLVAAGVPVLRLGGSLPSGARVTGCDVADLGDPVSATTWLVQRRGEPVVVCIDDLGPAGSAPALGGLPQLGAASGVVLLAAASAADLSTWFQGPVSALRRARSGVLLCPAPGEADVLGLRLPRTPVPYRPGSGWLIRGSGPERVQVARRRMRPDVAQSSSSTGPISCVAYQASS